VHDVPVGDTIRVFPRRTQWTPADRLAFVGDPPQVPPAPPAAEVHISVTFTWDREEAERLRKAWGQFYEVVKIGGPEKWHQAWEDGWARFISQMKAAQA